MLLCTSSRYESITDVFRVKTIQDDIFIINADLDKARALSNEGALTLSMLQPMGKRKNEFRFSKITWIILSLS